jgi:hypothetical protein
MARRNAFDSDQDRSERELTPTTADACAALEEEVETLQEQIALLEEGLPEAPGMERAALFKEIAAYRAALDSRRRALRQCHEPAQHSNTSE